MSVETTPDEFAPMAEYLRDFSDALYYGEELPVMSDEKLTNSQQARLGNFLLKADAGGRMIRRHHHNLDRKEAHNADLFTQQQGEQL